MRRLSDLFAPLIRRICTSYKMAENYSTLLLSLISTEVYFQEIIILELV